MHRRASKRCSKQQQQCSVPTEGITIETEHGRRTIEQGDQELWLTTMPEMLEACRSDWSSFRVALINLKPILPLAFTTLTTEHIDNYISSLEAAEKEWKEANKLKSQIKKHIAGHGPDRHEKADDVTNLQDRILCEIFPLPDYWIYFLNYFLAHIIPMNEPETWADQLKGVATLSKFYWLNIQRGYTVRAAGMLAQNTAVSLQGTRWTDFHKLLQKKKDTDLSLLDDDGHFGAAQLEIVRQIRRMIDACAVASMLEMNVDIQ